MHVRHGWVAHVSCLWETNWSYDQHFTLHLPNNIYNSLCIVDPDSSPHSLSSSSALLFSSPSSLLSHVFLCPHLFSLSSLLPHVSSFFLHSFCLQLQLFGVIVLAIGIWAIVQNQDYAFLTGSSVVSGGALLIVCGVITLTISAIGMVGVLFKLRPLLIIVRTTIFSRFFNKAAQLLSVCR